MTSPSDEQRKRKTVVKEKGERLELDLYTRMWASTGGVGSPVVKTWARSPSNRAMGGGGGGGVLGGGGVVGGWGVWVWGGCFVCLGGGGGVCVFGGGGGGGVVGGGDLPSNASVEAPVDCRKPLVFEMGKRHLVIAHGRTIVGGRTRDRRRGFGRLPRL